MADRARKTEDRKRIINSTCTPLRYTSALWVYGEGGGAFFKIRKVCWLPDLWPSGDVLVLFPLECSPSCSSNNNADSAKCQRIKLNARHPSSTISPPVKPDDMSNVVTDLGRWKGWWRETVTAEINKNLKWNTNNATLMT